MVLPVVAIVGQPNVGKSTLFNRIINQRLAIVEDKPGVTRDRNYAQAEWMGHKFDLIDTGGITWEGGKIEEEIRAQAEIAIEEADVIVMLTNVVNHVTDLDERIAHLLYRTKKPVILAVNKADNPEQRSDIYDFYSLGLGIRFLFQVVMVLVLVICLIRLLMIFLTIKILKLMMLFLLA